MSKLTKQERVRLTREIRKLIDEITPDDGGFYKSDMPVFVKGRKDVCVVIKHLEGKRKDLSFLVWIEEENIHSIPLPPTEGSQELKEAIEENGKIIIKILNSDSFSATFEIPLEKIGLKPQR